MAADTMSSISNWVVSTVLNYGTLKNYYEHPCLRSLCVNLGSGAGFGGLGFQVPIWSPGSEVFASASEAGAITPTSFSDSKMTLTMAKYALDHQVSDEILFASDGATWSNMVESASQELAYQADNYVSQLVCDQFTNFTGTEGSLTDTLSLDDLMLARADLQVADGVGGGAACVLHNRQYQDLYQSMRAETLDGLFNAAVAQLGRFGSVKGTVAGDILVCETGFVDTASSAYIGALFRPPAIGYKHGVPKNISSWSPGARILAVAGGEIQSELSAAGIALPEAQVIEGLAAMAQAQAQGMVPQIYVELGRQTNLDSRQLLVAGTLFAGVGVQTGRGIKLRSVVPS